MAKAIATNKIGGDLFSASDLIFDAQDIGGIGAVTSGEFMIAQTMGRLEVRIVANAETIVAGGETLIVEFQTASASGGAFATISTETLGPQTFAVGDEIYAFIPPRDVEDCYAKLVVTNSAAQNGDLIDAYLVQV